MYKAIYIASINYSEIHGNFPTKKCLNRGGICPLAQPLNKNRNLQCVACLFRHTSMYYIEIYSFFGDPLIATKIWEKLLLLALFSGIYFRSFSRTDI